MSSQALYITQGTYGYAWAMQLLDGLGAPVVLTDATSVLFSMRSRATGIVKLTDRAGEVAVGTYTLPDGSVQTFAATDGVLIYRPVVANGDADEVGVFEGLFKYSLPAGAVGQPGVGYLNIHIQPSF